MATLREIRRLAFQTLYQLDARAGTTGAVGAEKPETMDREAEAVLGGLLDDPDDPVSTAARFAPEEIREAFQIAKAAFAARATADAFMTEAAPGWPAHRQAAVDRAILRLAHYAMTATEGPGAGTPPKVIVNEAVELAKEFSTEKSPAFVNGLLDKLLKELLRDSGGGRQEHDGAVNGGGDPLEPEVLFRQPNEDRGTPN